LTSDEDLSIELLELKIYSLYATGEYSLQEVADKYKLSKSKVNRIIKKRGIHRGQIPDNTTTTFLEKDTKEKLQKHSTLIVDSYISVIESIKFAIVETTEINAEAKRLVVEMPQKLEQLIESIDKSTQSGLFKNPEEAQKMKYAIYKEIAGFNDFFNKMSIRLKSLNELGNWIDRFTKYEEEKIAISQVRDMLEIFFQAFNILDEENYQKIKEFIIAKSPSTAEYFNQYETIQPRYEVVDSEKQD